MMNSNEIKNVVRDYAVDILMGACADLRVVDEKPYTFLIPVELEGKMRYARVGLTCCQLETKSKDAYDAEDSTLAADTVPNFRAQREAEKLAKEAERKNKTKKKIEEDEVEGF